MKTEDPFRNVDSIESRFFGMIFRLVTMAVIGWILYEATGRPESVTRLFQGIL